MSMSRTGDFGGTIRQSGLCNAMTYSPPAAVSARGEGLHARQESGPPEEPGVHREISLD